VNRSLRGAAGLVAVAELFSEGLPKLGLVSVKIGTRADLVNDKISGMIYE
jgi:radical SAM superfamily enzyme